MTDTQNEQSTIDQEKLDLMLDRGLSNRLTLVVGPDALERGQALNDWLKRRKYPALHIPRPNGEGSTACMKNILDVFIEAGILEELPSECENGRINCEPEICQATLVELVNKLAMLDDDLVIVFRDYQPCDAGDHVLTFMLEHLPQHIHLYLCCDDAPGLSCIPRLRVRRQLQTIDTSNS